MTDQHLYLELIFNGGRFREIRGDCVPLFVCQIGACFDTRLVSLTMAFSRSARIWTLLIIDTIFLLIELVVGYAVSVF